mmetsp:Transcript_3980/g.6097  ORF Transcript_3980/g.6097 Transcript_3980/m.6097 type:complete len:143 (-) Transcript_3980:111-539(-)
MVNARDANSLQDSLPFVDIILDDIKVDTAISTENNGNSQGEQKEEEQEKQQEDNNNDNNIDEDDEESREQSRRAYKHRNSIIPAPFIPLVDRWYPRLEQDLDHLFEVVSCGACGCLSYCDDEDDETMHDLILQSESKQYSII